MLVRLDRHRCEGHALCAAKAPDVYELDDEGFCASDGRRVPPHFLAQARRGADHCPENAITLVEDEQTHA